MFLLTSLHGKQRIFPVTRSSSNGGGGGGGGAGHYGPILSPKRDKTWPDISYVRELVSLVMFVPVLHHVIVVLCVDQSVVYDLDFASTITVFAIALILKFIHGKCQKIACLFHLTVLCCQIVVYLMMVDTDVIYVVRLAWSVSSYRT